MRFEPPNAFTPLALDALRLMADSPRQEVIAPSTSIRKLSKAGGAVTARRTLDITTSRRSSAESNAWRLWRVRGRSEIAYAPSAGPTESSRSMATRG